MTSGAVKRPSSSSVACSGSVNTNAGSASTFSREESFPGNSPCVAKCTTRARASVPLRFSRLTSLSADAAPSRISLSPAKASSYAPELEGGWARYLAANLATKRPRLLPIHQARRWQATSLRACRIDGSGRDQLAEGGNESGSAFYLLPCLLIGHHGSLRASARSSCDFPVQFQDQGFGLPSQVNRRSNRLLPE